ncbi:MAG: MGMT family protein, partial [Chlamydiia bacterium]
PYAPEVPCHRVVAADGRLGGFMGCSEGEEVERKVQRLSAEAVEVKDRVVCDFSSRLHRFPGSQGLECNW